PSKRYLLDIRRGKESPVVRVEDIGLIMLVCGSDSRTDLSLVIESLDRIAPHAEIKCPMVVETPLILHPELLPRLDILIGRFPREHRPSWHTTARVKGKDLGRIVGTAIVNLHSRFHQMMTIGNPGMIQPHTPTIGDPLLVGCLGGIYIVGIGEG